MELETFFSFLSERFYKENDLSDITYAFMQANETFQDLFLEYCFGEKGIKPRNLWREYSSDDSRPDFYFTDQTNNEYLIEVKINDRNQHFKQYEREFSTAKKAFIANYEYNEKDSKNWDRKKTWGGFVKFLESYLESHKTGVKQKDLLKGYLKYLKSIINIKEFKKMDITKTKDLPTFYDNIVLVAQKNGWEKCGGNKKPNSKDFYGEYFKKDGLEFWFGLFYGDSDDAGVFLSFAENTKLANKIKKVQTNGKPYKNIQRADGWYYFQLNDVGMEILSNGKATKKDQEEVLYDFLKEVLAAVDA